MHEVYSLSVAKDDAMIKDNLYPLSYFKRIAYSTLLDLISTEITLRNPADYSKQCGFETPILHLADIPSVNLLHLAEVSGNTHKAFQYIV